LDFKIEPPPWVMRSELSCLARFETSPSRRERELFVDRSISRVNSAIDISVGF